MREREGGGRERASLPSIRASRMDVIEHLEDSCGEFFGALGTLIFQGADSVECRIEIAPYRQQVLVVP